jgi:dTDP-4-amino-4,6-dideoxygalactose transaminase
MGKLAIDGGTPAVTIPWPHEPWPPEASPDELSALSAQRNIDIGIAGRVGPILDFEEEFLAFMEHQVAHAVTFNSGTSALFAAYYAAGVTSGTEVIGPALTYHAALSPVYALGGDVVLVDVDPVTRCIDPKLIEAAITPRTVAVTAVHQWGHPAAMDEILDIASRHGLLVVEDCSHAHGSSLNGRLVGTFGDVAVFSLQAKKAIFAGEGGILVTNRDDFRDRATLIGHYRDRSRDEVSDSKLQEYWETGFGLKLRMSPFNAIVATHSLRNFPGLKKQRRDALNHLNDVLDRVGFLDRVAVLPGVDMGAWYGFKPLYRSTGLGGVSRETMVTAMRAEGAKLSVPSGPVLAGLNLYRDVPGLAFPATRSVANEIDHFPVAQAIEASAVSFPSFYRWPHDRQIIDQYAVALAKVAGNVDRLRELEEQRKSAGAEAGALR